MARDAAELVLDDDHEIVIRQFVNQHGEMVRLAYHPECYLQYLESERRAEITGMEEFFKRAHEDAKKMDRGELITRPKRPKR